jgi:hypothetical protein
MKMYLVKTKSVATANNKNFAGETRVYLIGKNLCTEYKEEYLKFYAKEYGYKSLSGAKQRLKSQQELCAWETAKGYWITSCKVIEIEI